MIHKRYALVTLCLFLTVIFLFSPVFSQDRQKSFRIERTAEPPKIDGLILQDGYHKGTFLPSVWESLPDKYDFLQHLKLKAGLSADHWSDTIKVFRYTVEKV